MVSKSVKESHVAKNTETQFCGTAVVIRPGGPTFETRDVKTPAADEVVIGVKSLGLCRTDLRVFNGQLAVPRPLVPGHEFSGVVARVGRNVNSVGVGDRVAVNPVLACRSCEFCNESPQDCQHTQFLGVDLDGACAEFATVPQSATFRIPDTLGFDTAAFAEPVAASLAVLNADIKPNQQGVLLGSNRIAVLTRRILEAHGFLNVTCCGENDSSRLPANTFDFAIETLATTATVNTLIRSLRPRGTLILKSRQPTPVQLTISDLLPKQLRIECVNYGSFHKAIDLLNSGTVNVQDLVGPSFAIADFQQAFVNAAQDEYVKTFIKPNATSTSQVELS